MRPIYLDHHATTPCDPAVVAAMLPYFTERFGNAASRSHVYGSEAKAGVELAREQIANLIGASPKELVFTSGATEADNLAVLGVARQAGRGHVVVSAIEHKAVLDAAKQLQREGFEVSVLQVDAAGQVRPSDLQRVLRDDTVLVSVMLANNEVGSVQPIAELAALLASHPAHLHTDATQAPGRLPIDVATLGVDLMSLSAHKMYGPKGVGALFVRRGRPRVRVAPLLHGGGHERGMRSGTLPVPLCVGMGKAAELAAADIAAGRPAQIAELRDRLWEGLRTLDDVAMNGHPTARLSNNLNVTVRGVESSALLMAIRTQIACSTGSACSSATLEPSYVLRAMGVSDDDAHSSLRFGLGRSTTASEVDQAIEVLTTKVAELRSLGPTFSL